MRSFASPALAANQRTSNNEAYRLYLRGQDKLDRRGQGFLQSADLFREAIHLDTLFAPAYAGLSMTLALSPYSQDVAWRDLAYGVAGAAARALALDSTLVQPHVALGLAYQYDYQWDSAETEFQTAIRLDGRHVEGRIQYGKHLLFRGRHAEALLQLREARAEDPASAVVLSWLSFAYYLNHQLDSALVESRRALENDSSNATSLGLGAMVRLGNNLPGEARKLIGRTTPNIPANSYVIPKLGDTASARKRLRELDALTPTLAGGNETGLHVPGTGRHCQSAVGAGTRDRRQGDLAVDTRGVRSDVRPHSRERPVPGAPSASRSHPLEALPLGRMVAMPRTAALRVTILGIPS